MANEETLRLKAIDMHKHGVKVAEIARNVKKVPIVERKRQFVLVSGEDIVWIVGRRTDERFRVGNNTENILKITKLTI